MIITAFTSASANTRCTKVFNALKPSNVKNRVLNYLGRCKSELFERVRFKEIRASAKSEWKKTLYAIPISTAVIMTFEANKKNAVNWRDGVVLSPSWIAKRSKEIAHGSIDSYSAANLIMNGVIAAAFVTTSAIPVCKKLKIDLPVTFGIVSASLFLTGEGEQGYFERTGFELGWDAGGSVRFRWTMSAVRYFKQAAKVYLRPIGWIIYTADQIGFTYLWEVVNNWLFGHKENEATVIPIYAQYDENGKLIIPAQE